jgi:hypothetical protein
MPSHSIDRPFQVVLIASFQFLKATILIGAAALLWFAPDVLPHTIAFSELLYIAAHGKDLNGYLVPIFGAYVAYVGWGIFTMRPGTRQTLALSSAITIAVSIYRLGYFGGPGISGTLDRESLYILMLLDLTIYIYLVFHPEIVRSFGSRRRMPPLHS